MSKIQGRISTGKRKTTYGTSTYVQGNTVRKTKVREEIREQPKKRLSHAARKNREKAVYMSFGYVLYLSAALLAAGFILIGYIRLQSDITNSIANISKLESRLNTLRMDNDESYNRVLASVDLEEIKRIAIEELGMTYADEGQVLVIPGEKSDYVMQYKDLPADKRKH